MPACVFKPFCVICNWNGYFSLTVLNLVRFALATKAIALWRVYKVKTRRPRLVLGWVKQAIPGTVNRAVCVCV